MKNLPLISVILILCCIQIVWANDLLVDEKGMTFGNNPLQGTQSNRIAMLFPLMLLAICIISAFIDFASIGVIIGSVLVLIVGFLFGILPISITMLITMGVMGLLFIWKLIA